MRNNRQNMVACIYLCMLAACGGGSGGASDAAGNGSVNAQQVADLRSQAAAKKEEAINLGVDTPCQADSQCAIQTFDFPDPGCNLPNRGSYDPYSLISPTASQAQAAAADQRALAARSRALQSPGPPLACPAIAVLPPVPACVQDRCVLKSQLTGEIWP